MTRILLRSPKSPFEVVSPKETLDRNLVATNSGNLIFLEAAWKILAAHGTELVPDRLRVDPSDADAINAEYDAYVIPLANAFRLSYEPTLIRMAKLISCLRIPVVILGVGAQLALTGNDDRLRPIEGSVRSFVKAVLDRSGPLGVRGEMTADYLRGLGFRDVEVIGCPSMFLYGDRLRVEKPDQVIGPDARISINISPYVRQMSRVVAHHVARYPRLTYIAQDLPTLEMLLWGEDPPNVDRASDLPVHTAHPLYRQGRMRYYVDPWPWIADLKGFDFSFGTRIHGNIAATLAGTPAYVLAHDSRTLELARHFGLPHRQMPRTAPDLDAADLYAEADYRALNEGQADRFAAFRAYLRGHGLHDAFEQPEDAERFDRRIAELPFPPAVDGSIGWRPMRSVERLERRARRILRRAARAKVVRAARLRAAGRPPLR